VPDARLQRDALDGGGAPRAPSLESVVLRSADLAAARSFYAALGFVFVEERHGQGPVHFAAVVGAFVLELYPAEPGGALARRASGAAQLGFSVASLDDVLAALAALGAPVLTPLRDAPRGRYAVVADPDGRAIELTGPA
jgi:catechol 2,3-dioxygenase-like lactoylglutathione lyase family enzyme